MNPEFREEREWNFEKKHFSPDMEKRLLQALDAKKEVFADVVQCPNASCGVPVKVEMFEDYIELKCGGCGWSRIIRRAE